jgi:hypothetical protein
LQTVPLPCLQSNIIPANVYAMLSASEHFLNRQVPWDPNIPMVRYQLT